MKVYYKCLAKKTYQNGYYTLEAVQPEDIEKIRQWRNEQIDVLRQSKPISKEEQIAYYKRYIWSELKSNQPKNILLSYKYKNKLIGYGGLVNLSWQDKKAEISFIVNTSITKDSIKYKNIFKNYLIMIKDIAFRNLNFNKLFTETYSFRFNHIKILEGEGFLKEGAMKEHIIQNGHKFDSIIHGIINDKK